MFAPRHELPQDPWRSPECGPERPPQHVSNGERLDGRESMLNRSREAGAHGGRLRGMSKDDLLKLRRRPQRPFAPPEKEVRQRFDVPRAPPPNQRRSGSPGDRRAETARLEKGLRDAVSDDELLVMAGITHQRPPAPGASSKEVAFLQRAADRSIRPSTGDQRTRRGIRGQIGDEG